MRRRSQTGAAVLETALVAIPLFVLVLSTFELGRGLWMYHTLTSAVKSGVRYAIVHGEDCIAATSSCAATVSDVTSVIKTVGAGLQASDLELTFTADGETVNCPTLSSCSANSGQWPPDSANTAGQSITITGRYSFHPVLAAFWPGHSSASMTYVTRATEAIQF